MQSPNLELTNDDGQTPLLMALEASKDSSKISKILLDAGADPNAPNQDGDSILQVLIRKKKIKSAEILIENGNPGGFRRFSLNRLDVNSRSTGTQQTDKMQNLNQYKILNIRMTKKNIWCIQLYYKKKIIY